jgi:DNA-binding NarL/FixJ family response regulator
MATPITILLVDDHRLIRESWAEMLDEDPTQQVVGAAATIEEAINLSIRFKPQIILMDISLGEESGFDAITAIREFSPTSKIIGLSMHTIPAYVKKTIEMGACGYVTKNSTRKELIAAINAVLAGGNYICAEVKDIINDRLTNTGQAPEINNLTKKEIEIVKLIKNGLTSNQIGKELHVGIKTIEAHRYNILKKLGLKNTASLVNYINEHGL